MIQAHTLVTLLIGTENDRPLFEMSTRLKSWSKQVLERITGYPSNIWRPLNCFGLPNWKAHLDELLTEYTNLIQIA